MINLHPVNRLAFWLWLTAWLPWLERQWLYGLTVIILAWTMLRARERFLRAFPRMKWLLLAVGGIYFWTTPGEYLWSGWFAPTREGIALGLSQMLRLLAILASLQLLLTNMRRPAIFAGLYAMVRPLEWLGFPRDRMALRLALTLEMMEKLLETRMPIQHLMHELQQPLDVHADREVLLPVWPMSWFQLNLLGVQVLGILAALWLAGFGIWE